MSNAGRRQLFYQIVMRVVVGGLGDYGLQHVAIGSTRFVVCKSRVVYQLWQIENLLAQSCPFPIVLHGNHHFQAVAAWITAIGNDRGMMHSDIHGCGLSIFLLQYRHCHNVGKTVEQ